MKPIHPVGLMWIRACDTLESAERPSRRVGRRAVPAWEPSVDVFEGETDVLVRIALPDFERRDLEIRVDVNGLSLSGNRRFPSIGAGRYVRRLEIPYGRVERRVALPPGGYRLAAEKYRHGCLEIRLERTADDE